MQLRTPTFETSFGELLQVPYEGQITFDLKDAITGKQLEYWKTKNLITLDAGILAARLFKNTLLPAPARNNGLIMLGVGTGGGAAPVNTTRSLVAELARKAFSSALYIDGGGIPSAVPTNVVDFEVVFGAAEAIGNLNEMGLMCTESLNPAVWTPVIDPGYDPTIDVTGKDLLANYFCWLPASVKPPASILTLTWRIFF